MPEQLPVAGWVKPDGSPVHGVDGVLSSVAIVIPTAGLDSLEKLAARLFPDGVTERGINAVLVKKSFHPALRMIPEESVKKLIETFETDLNIAYLKALKRTIYAEEGRAMIRFLISRLGPLILPKTPASEFVDALWENTGPYNHEAMQLWTVSQLSPEKNCAVIADHNQFREEAPRPVIPCDLGTMLWWKGQNKRNTTDRTYVLLGTETFDGKPEVRTLFNPLPGVPAGRRFEVRAVRDGMVFFFADFQEARRRHHEIIHQIGKMTGQNGSVCQWH